MVHGGHQSLTRCCWKCEEKTRMLNCTSDDEVCANCDTRVVLRFACQRDDSVVVGVCSFVRSFVRYGDFELCCYPADRARQMRGRTARAGWCAIPPMKLVGWLGLADISETLLRAAQRGNERRASKRSRGQSCWRGAFCSVGARSCCWPAFGWARSGSGSLRGEGRPAGAESQSRMFGSQKRHTRSKRVLFFPAGLPLAFVRSFVRSYLALWRSQIHH